MFVKSCAVFVLAIAAAPTHAAAPLEDYSNLLVGDWTEEGIYAADYPGIGKKGEKFTVTVGCRWTAGRSAIACEGRDARRDWTSLYWWDAGSKQIRSVDANSGGNSDICTTAKQGAKYLWTCAGSFADGRPVKYEGQTLVEDGGNTRIDVGATILEGSRSEFRDTYRRVK